MASGMLTGERRWASSRRGGMAVVGKVAVPKPINLPSQRLENHGQDRDVKIVPKGTLGWGSKPSSSTSNAWGTSVQSPNTDCSTGSASHLGGRPSSGGNGTRPSSAGSDITQGSASAWGPNSRPSSAAGSLASNQQPLISLRPQSAETRLGSSQLSRFSDSVQRLESHGQERDVDTEPKGTLRLGSKPSSSTSSAWGTSIQSLNTNGRTGSPSHLACASSSDSGTRPSTALSDIIHEHSASDWDPSSRPSASGSLTSNQQSLISLRPHGSETRLGSSQSSRFSESLAVPKPINLPSQRLERHGQHRDVEIFPKGTLRLGSKPSSSTSSAWGTSIQSVNTDGRTGSPSHLAHASSGGSGARLSTAESDIIREHSASAWDPSSRPSASGSLTSNQQSLISLHPHGSETRLGSSQSSRFSEPLAVPKPINLPSQRFERHGQHRDVENPKGTLRLGSKPSSSTSSAWGISIQSLDTDGRTGSPGHLAWAFSGGSGARPSTDIVHEHSASAWDPSSRPSASGLLTSNQQSLISLRPHTSETRLGGSQSSRFSEPLAVPKPLNLPSQRLERHGQHRDVEILSKATLCWGSKPSSSTSSAWSTSVQSPNADGCIGSQSNLEARPSSGGSGTRPSSAESDITHDHNASASGPSSRPSSASGSLGSNQQPLISLRPRSAETRLGSSQLSRIAEGVSDNTTAWGAGSADKLGTKSSKSDRFPLSSGDFPTLGLDNESCGRNIENQDLGPQGRPGSSSGGGPPRKGDFGNSVGDFPFHGNARSENSNSWRRETQPYDDNGARPRIDKWHAEPQPYNKSSLPPQHYDAWHGPPVNNHQGGVWYGGHPGGPPFGPGGFPMEPFPYYRPQLIPPILANPLAVSGGGSGHRGPRPNNGDFIGPHMHDAFVRPGMTLRPGFYPGPVPCDGYYGPPMRNTNPNEQQISSMGTTVGPSAYNLFSGPNAPDMGNSNILSGYAPSSEAMVLEHIETGRSHEARAHDAHKARTHDARVRGGQPKVLLKQYDCWEDRDEQQKRENINSYSLCPAEDDWQRNSSSERSWNVDHKRDGEADGRKVTHGGVAPWELNEQRMLPVKIKSLASLRNLKGDVNSFKRLDDEELGTPELPEVSAAPRNPISLMQKIEGINAKVRVTDGLQDVPIVSGWEEQQNNLQVGVSKTNTHGKGADSGLISHETHKNHIPPGDRTGESAVTSGTAIFRNSNQSMHDRAGIHRLSTKEADGRHERSRVTYLAAGSMVDIRNSVTHGQDHTTAEAGTENVDSSRDNVEGELPPPAADLSDAQLQRATMLELAKQQLQQREKEEEERARDQKAKALAKLEELNRRTRGEGEDSAHKLENTCWTADQNEQEERLCSIQTAVVAGTAGASGSDFLDLKPTSVVLDGEINPNRVEKSSSSSTEDLLETPKMVGKESVSVQEQAKNLHVKSDDSHHVDVPHIYDKGVPQQKVSNNVQNQNMLREKKSVDKLESSPVAKNTTVYFGGVAVEISSSGATSSLISTAVVTETLQEHKTKSWGGKNDIKLDETSANLASASMVSEDKSKLSDTTAQETVLESAQLRTLKDAVNIPSVQPNTGSKNANKPLEQCASSPNKESHGRVNNQWKSLYSNRTSRNPTATRSIEKFHGTDSVVWAPVRPQNKAEVSDKVGQRNIVDDASPSIKSNRQVQHSQRNKQIEMERDIPNQVSKELVHSIRQAAVPLINQASQDVKVQKSYSPKDDNLATSRKVVSSMESKNGDGKQSKPGKTFGPWCKRGIVESTGSFHLDDGKNLLKLTERPEPQGSDVIPVKEPQSVDEWNTSDDWNTPETPFAPAPALVVKVSGGTAAKGKRQPFRGHKGAGHTRDSDDKRINCGDRGKGSSQSPAVALRQVESTATSKERCVVGDQTISHWQPKSHVLATNHQGSMSSGTQNVVNEMSRPGGKDSSIQLPPQSESENTATQQPGHKRSISQEASVIEHQETRRERRSILQKGHHGKGQWGPGHDYRQNSASENRERYRHNPHFEYQPVGPQNNITVNVQEPPINGSQKSSSRFKERNHSHSRRGAGHFYGRHSGNIQVNASDK